MIDKRLYDSIGMIADGGDTVGTTCQYAMVYEDEKLFRMIEVWLIQPYNYKNLKHVRYRFYRSKYHLDEEINDQSRDHVFWYKIVSKYFKIDNNNWYFKSLKPFGRISDKFRMTPDLWLFVRDKNVLWQLTLLLYLPFVTLITKLIHWLWLPQTTPDKYEAKARIYYHSETVEFDKIKTFHELWAFRKILKNNHWSFMEYLFAEIWTWATYRPYTLHQTAWALYVSKNIPFVTFILKRCFRWMTWKGNPIVTLLTK